MTIFRCKMCGGTIEFEKEARIGVCDSCDTKQTVPYLDSDKRINLYDRANHFRRNNEFDEATMIYEQILNEDNTDAEAYWSLVLCRFGIEYVVEEPSSYKRVPTVNRTQYTSIYVDENYKSALKYADAYQKSIYEEEARIIDEIQKGILEISNREKPFGIDPKNEQALFEKLMTKLEGQKQENLKNCNEPFYNNRNFQKILKFVNEKMKSSMNSYIEFINNRNKQKLFSIICHRLLVLTLKKGGLVEAKEFERIKKIENWEEKLKESEKIIKTIYEKAEFLKKIELTAEALTLFHALRGYRDSTKQYLILGKELNKTQEISAGFSFTVRLKSNGTVAATGDLLIFNQFNVSEWKDIVSISAGFWHTVGLKSDGTVVVTGSKSFAQCNVSKWKDIISISAGYRHTVGLKSDGTVVTKGSYSSGQRNVSWWKDIVSISAGGSHTVGLKSDGTVVATRNKSEDQGNVCDWKDIISISAGFLHTVGLKSDGTDVDYKKFN